MTRIRHDLRVQAKVLRRLTKKAGIRAIARSAGLPAMRVSRFAAGTGETSTSTLYAVAAALKCRIELVTP